MPPLVIPSTVRTGLVWSMSGSEYAVNVLHYFVGPATIVSQATADDFATDVGTAFAAAGSWQDQVANIVSLARVSVRDLRTANLPEFTSAVSLAGAAAQAPLPPANSVVVTLRTAFAGKSFRGRVYLPGASELAATTTGAIEAAAMDSAEQFINALQLPIVQGNEWALGVMSPTLGEINTVESITVRDAVFDTQRRRAYNGI